MKRILLLSLIVLAVVMILPSCTGAPTPTLTPTPKPTAMLRPTPILTHTRTPIPTRTPTPTPRLTPIPTPRPVIESRIDGDFTGWNGDSIYKLLNGQIWHQAEYKYLYHYSYSPEIMIYRTSRGYEMKVNGVQGTVLVEELTGVIESRINGQFVGWDGGSIYKLMNGQVWQQAELKLSLYLLLNPEIMIYQTSRGYEMKVNGVEGSVLVKRLTLVVESEIDGKFTGWTGDSVYRLRNGQTWHQIEYKYLYHYAWSPKVIIAQASDGYRMAVEGVGGSVRVERIWGATP